ncbi:hypothetical protein FTX61_14135 [Nitriliruptoraceae bacterium ZYF776]|nr:hypothetical protein [Profundirhabdus halotolerans]
MASIGGSRLPTRLRVAREPPPGSRSAALGVAAPVTIGHRVVRNGRGSVRLGRASRQGDRTVGR